MCVESGAFGDASFPELEVNVVPAFYEAVASFCCDEAVEHRIDFRPEFDYEASHLIRCRRVFDHVPADVLNMPEKERPDINPDAAVEIQQWQANEIPGMWAHVWSCHFLLIECSRKERCFDKIFHVYRGARDAIQDADSPLGPQAANPVDHIPLNPGRHLVKAGVPESPYIFVGRNRMKLLQPGFNLSV